MSDTGDKPNPLLHHIYDDIEEHDNRLPNWWLGLLWGTILFAFGYWFYFEVFDGPKQLDEYKAELAEVAAKAPPKKVSDDDSLLALVNDAAVVKQGAEAFSQTCAACHGAKGEGTIGPNLTDKYWLHGGKPTQIEHTISNGVLEKGMPAWGPALGAERVRALTVFLLTQKDKNVPGKAPQGDPML